MADQIVIRPLQAQDRPFILSLSPRLAEVAKLSWHDDDVIQKMQDDYIIAMLEQTDVPCLTLVAKSNDILLGFIHMSQHQDSISAELCATVPLLAVAPSAQGQGVGKLLIAEAETWAKEKNYRLLHLEVFANNTKAHDFYQHIGFKDETLHMIKTL